MNTMYYGPIRVLKGCLPYMRAHKSGTIVNMSSIFGFVPCLSALPYNAVKFAIEGLTESLELDLAPFNIRTIILEPGLFRTEVLARCEYPEKGTRKEFLDANIGANYKFVETVVKDPEAYMPGDPNKLGDRVVEFVDRTGMAKGLDPKHMRLVLGSDAWTQIKDKMKRLQANFDDMEAIAYSTNYDAFDPNQQGGVGAIPSQTL